MALGFILAWLGITTTIDKIQSEHNRTQAKNEGKLYYYDKHGSLRDRITNDYARIITDENGDRCVVTFSGRIIENLTEKNDLEKRKKDYESAIKDGTRTVYFYRSNRGDYSQAIGDRYADKNTGELYVKRSIKFNFIDEELGLIWYTANVYMDLSGKLIRETDESIKRYKELKGKKGYIQNSEELTLKCIKYYNTNREKSIKNGTWIEHYSNNNVIY